MTETLRQRIRRKNGQPKGVLVAKKINNTTMAIGWSLCKKPDTFDMEFGTKIAVVRADKFDGNKLPHSIKNDFDVFVKRCHRYFKGNEIIGVKLFQEKS